MRAIRSSVEDGDTRKMRSSSWASEAAIQASASSGVRSGVIAPDPPAAARSRAKASGPYFSIRFQYVITTAWVPVSATASTAAKASRVRTPRASALVPARWMVTPSIIGSL